MAKAKKKRKCPCGKTMQDGRCPERCEDFRGPVARVRSFERGRCMRGRAKEVAVA